MANFTIHNLKPLLVAWRAAGLDPAVDEELAGYLERHDNVIAAYSAYRHGGSFVDVAARFADGDISFTDAVAGAAAQSQRDVAFKVYDLARQRVLSLAGRWLAGFGDGLIVDHLAPREAALFVEARPHAETLDGLVTPEEAFAAGADTTAAWHALDHLVDTRAALTKVYTHGVCAAGGKHGDWDHAHPDLVPRCPDHLRGVDGGWHRVRKLADLVLSDAGPRVLVAPPDEPARPEGGRARPAGHSLSGPRPVVEAGTTT